MRSYDYHRQAKIDKAIDKTGGVYPGGNGDDYLHAGLPGVGYIASRWSQVVSTAFICTRADFESRKAERQGKPDWSKAPAWVNWAAQDEEGRWFWYGKKPEVDGLEFVEPSNDGKVIYAASAGEVIGNWQDTLEQRPERIHPLSDMGVAPKLEGVGNSVVREADEIAEARRSFAKLSTGLQDLYREAFGQAIVSMQKPEPDGAAWYDYERRQALKLPPVGIVCEVQAGRRWSKTHVVAHHIDGARAIFCDDGFSCGELAYCAAIAFRPLDWNRNQEKPEQSPELSFHLANASNELQASAKLLPAESNLLQSITGVIAAIQAIREAV